MTHWYDKNGGMHYGASLKEARENKYYLSVTSVEDVMYNHGLEQWKIRQAIMSALTAPRFYHADNLGNYHPESDADCIARILDDSRQQARKAAKLGSVIHKLAERYISDKPLFFKGLRHDVWVLFKPLQRWIDDNIESGEAEKVLVNNEWHYAGKADFIGITADSNSIILDFKTTFVTPDDIKKDGNIKKTKIRDSWGRQLAALLTASHNWGDCISVIISTNIAFPGVWTYNWKYYELAESLEIFSAALKLAQIQKGLIYD